MSYNSSKSLLLNLLYCTIKNYVQFTNVEKDVLYASQENVQLTCVQMHWTALQTQRNATDFQECIGERRKTTKPVMKCAQQHLSQVPTVVMK